MRAGPDTSSAERLGAIPLLLLFLLLSAFPGCTFPTRLPSRAGFCPDPGGRDGRVSGGRGADEKHMGKPSLRSKTAARGRSFQRKKNPKTSHERREERWHVELKSINVEALIYANVFVCVENVSMLSLSNL